MNPIQIRHTTKLDQEHPFWKYSQNVSAQAPEVGCIWWIKKKYESIAKGWEEKDSLGLQSHPFQRGMSIPLLITVKKNVLWSAIVVSFFGKRSGLRKRFIEEMKDYSYGHIFSPNKSEHIDKDVFVHLLICTLYLKFSQNFKGCVPWSSNKFASAALVLIIQKNTETLHLLHY